MREIGLDPNTGRGKRGDGPRLREQMRRLFVAGSVSRRNITTLKYTANAGGGWMLHQRVNFGGTRKPLCKTTFGKAGLSSEKNSIRRSSSRRFRLICGRSALSSVRLSRSTSTHGRAIRAFTVTKKGKPQFIPWAGLMMQLGADYAERHDFRKKASAALRKVQVVYPWSGSEP